jgi:hypothetical protein
MKSVLAPASDPQVKVDLRWRQKLHAQTVQRQEPGVKRARLRGIVDTSAQKTGSRSETIGDDTIDLRETPYKTGGANVNKNLAEICGS